MKPTKHRTKRGYFRNNPEKERETRISTQTIKYLKILMKLCAKDKYTKKLPEITSFIEGDIKETTIEKRLKNIRKFFRLILLMNKHGVIKLEEDQKIVEEYAFRLRFVNFYKKGCCLCEIEVIFHRNTKKYT